MSSEFEQTGASKEWEGSQFSVEVGTFRHADGEEVERQIVRRMPAVAMVAVDDLHVWLVRQPREAAGEPDLLELPAGKLDKEGEEPLETAKRELAEEIGKAASDWSEIASFWTSPGLTSERCTVYLASGLSDASADSGENERIEVIPWPLSDLDSAITGCHDSKSLIGLIWLARHRERERASE
jgi:8-oxo-dGTP pyrophosphatase MutT (NUDIX family)